MRRPGATVLIAAAILLLGGGLPPAAASKAPAGKAPAGKAPASKAPAEGDGFLYGTVHTEGGRHYTGVLRWGDEEAFRDDLFNGAKDDLPYIDRLPEERRQRREIRVLGIQISYDWSEDATGRQFIARFGDLREIRPRGGDKVDVVMKNGTTYRLDDGSNDIGATVVVQDADVGVVEVAWKKIDRIVFAPAPAGLVHDVRRLQGDVTTEDGVFRGFIQWDSHECLSTDRLDGKSEDGKLSLEMGRIRSIEKQGRNESAVTLADGRTFDLRGSNDVDSTIRGILVEDERYGRVRISWDAFERADFRDATATGRGDAAYAPATPLRGTVTDREGRKWPGRLVFDLDESESFEMLNGDRDGVEYNIPFAMVKSVEPLDDDACSVTLRSGVALHLDESQDVTESNAGVLVLHDADGPERYLPWDEVRRIDFE